MQKMKAEINHSTFAEVHCSIVNVLSVALIFALIALLGMPSANSSHIGLSFIWLLMSAVLVLHGCLWLGGAGVIGHTSLSKPFYFAAGSIPGLVGLLSLFSIM